MTSTVPEPQTDMSARVTELEARLAIVEEVGRALAGEPNLSAVTELVGERLHDLFPDTDFFVALYDAASNLISFPFEWAAGMRHHMDPIPAEKGLTATVISSKRSAIALSAMSIMVGIELSPPG